MVCRMNEPRDAPLGLSHRLLRLSGRVEHRIATSQSEREAVFRLRHDAYSLNGLLQSCQSEEIYDPCYDDAPTAWITMTLVDGELAGSVRVNLGAGLDAVLPSLRVYPDVVGPKMAAGKTVIEYTRLAAKLSLSSLHPELAYLIMRPGYMAAVHFHADLAIASPRLEHAAFYKRVFGGELWCQPREYPGLTAKFACMGSDFHAVRSVVEARYPFYKSTASEREALFGPERGGPRRRLRAVSASDNSAQLSPCA